MANGSGNVSNVINLGSTNVSGLVNPAATFSIPPGASLFSLETAYPGGIGGGNYGHFYKNGSVYQVTSGKICYVVAIIFNYSAIGLAAFQLMSATNNFSQNASSVTGGVWQYGAAGEYGYGIATANVPFVDFKPYQFAASTYPGFQSNNNSGQGYIELLAYEA